MRRRISRWRARGMGDDGQVQGELPVDEAEPAASPADGEDAVRADDTRDVGGDMTPARSAADAESTAPEAAVDAESTGDAAAPATDAAASSADAPPAVAPTPAPTPTPAPVDERAQRLARAEKLVDSGDTAGAIEAYRSLVLDSPRDVSSRIALGRLYERRGDTRLALEQYEAARLVDAENVDVMICAAGVQTTLREFDAAERDLRRAVRLDPTRAAAHSLLGTVSFRRGLYQQAEQELKRALDLDPGDAHAYFYRGEALNQLYRVDEALDMLERAVALQPGIPRAYYIMGILYDKKGRSAEAADMYRRAREIGAA